MKMNKWTGKLVVGTFAATLLFGGIGGLTVPQAFADDDGDTVIQAPNTSIPLGQRVNLELNTIVSKAASLLDMEDNDLNAQLAGGKTLTDIISYQGANRSEIYNQIVQELEQTVSNAQSEQVITSDEAKQLNSLVEKSVQTAFDTPGYQDHAIPVGTAAAAPNNDLVVQQAVDTGALADFLGVSSDELNKELTQGGKKLADIASEKGISEDQLVAKLKDLLTPALQDFIHTK
ncbi:hypothetical protein LJK88_03275 [Paenibacillus sp. P26]|nr:hypothetical protein LJK88_03275 [Paenibacillus sp. P26]UUZ90859.1 hypothetical protein LJK87_34220 [Paenibacillus sp. P25]